MKKYIKIIITMFILNIVIISCLKNDSSTSSVATSMNRRVYYYKLCNVRSPDLSYARSWICRYSCNANISFLTYENVKEHCKTPTVTYDTSRLQVFSEYAREEIIPQIMSYKTFKKLGVPDKDFKDFNDALYDYGKRCEYKNGTNTCDEICNQGCNTYGIIYNPWTETVSGSDTIYSQYFSSDPDLIQLQWSKVMGEMDYNQAGQTCKSSRFMNLTGWTLPSYEVLVKVAKDGLGDLLNIDDNDLVWSSTEKDGQVAVYPLKKKDNQKDDQEDNIDPKNLDTKDKIHYTICVRKHM